MKKYLHSLLLSLILFVLSGVVLVISKDVRREVARDLSPRDVIKAPNAYKEKVVLWGGIIIESKNLEEEKKGAGPNWTMDFPSVRIRCMFLPQFNTFRLSPLSSIASCVKQKGRATADPARRERF